MMAANPMRRIHLAIGVLTVVIFLITGQLMGHHKPPMATLQNATRLMFRSRHIYILASGLVNVMLGLYMQQRMGWRRIVQAIGSALVVASPAILIVAFTMEPEKGFQQEMPWSAAGLFVLFGGSMAHLASSSEPA